MLIKIVLLMFVFILMTLLVDGCVMSLGLHGIAAMLVSWALSLLLSVAILRNTFGPLEKR